MYERLPTISQSFKNLYKIYGQPNSFSSDDEEISENDEEDGVEEINSSNKIKVKLIKSIENNLKNIKIDEYLE